MGRRSTEQTGDESRAKQGKYLIEDKWEREVSQFGDRQHCVPGTLSEKPPVIAAIAKYSNNFCHQTAQITND